MRRGNSIIWFDVDVFKDTLDAALEEDKAAVKSAIYSTMAKVRGHSVTKLSLLIRDRWNISKSDLDKKIIIRVGSRGNGYESFEMTIKGISASLSYFSAKQYMGNKVVTRKVGKVNKRVSKFQGVEVEVIKGRKTRLPHAFMQAASTGHMMVLTRKGKSRYPIEAKAVISPASMFSQASTADAFEEDVMDFLERTFAHELDWRLK